MSITIKHERGYPEGYSISDKSINIVLRRFNESLICLLHLLKQWVWDLQYEPVGHYLVLIKKLIV